VPIGYLIGAILWAACTAAALRPPRRPRLLARAGYLVGLAVNEVPHLAAALLLTSTAITLGEGDLAGDVVSVLALSLTALTLAGLAVIAWRGMRARDSVAAALEHAGIPVPQGARRRWMAKVLLTPFPTRPRTVARTANLAYGEHRRQRLDVYRRRDAPVGGPVLLYLHGGGYFSGGKHWEARALLHRLAERGWVCVSATYRLRPTAGFEDHLLDAKKALAWAHVHAQDYGGDASGLVMAGSSAGAHLASICALTQNDPALQPGFEGAPTRVDAAVGLYGYYGRYYGRGPDESPVSTPLALDAAAAPPFFLAHGDQDSNVPVEGARALAAKLRAESPGPVVYAELPGGQHGFDLLRSWRFAAVLDGLDAFLADRRVGVGAGAPGRHAHQATAGRRVERA
jgi:acetyl esterase/lipase